ncbi:hypothetical protein NEMBOFW57_005640 [Staphylotrichum longicolle]|uniref:NmrA-like domain-containing protein n=1 Tax=Staphylotrichum longicolle TaxID=669026 RepID=A0AAD4EXE2_9PEZI|nr:hypothetical protein NEMBOFW57_005640 [Staphylotrichum longicolle]
MPPPSILVIGAGELGTAILSALTATRPRPLHHAPRRPPPRRNPRLPVPATRSSLARLAAQGIAFETGDFINTPLPELVAVFRNVAVRRLLAGQSGTGWTVVSTGLFMSFLFLKGFGAVDLKGRVLRGLGGWGNEVTVTDVEGIGKVVAELVYEPAEGNGVVYVAGDTVSYAEVADLVEEVYGGEWKREEWDREFLKKRLEEQPGDLMLKYQNAFGAGVGVSWEKEKTVNYQRGIKIPDLRGFLRDNKNRLLETAE